MRVFSKLMASGYGFISDDESGDSILREVELEYRNHTYCKSIYWNADFDQKTGTQICANAQDKSICVGDSGGPLMATVDGLVYTVGLTSWIINCHDYVYPAAFTRVSSFLNWINSHVTDGDYCK